MQSRIRASLSIPRILLADDSRMFQTMFVELLGKAGHEVILANSGSEALARLTTGRMDFICSAFYLRDMEGIALCQAIRDLPNGTRTPFALLTAVDDSSQLTRALPAGVTEIFNKRDVGQLLAFIRRFTFPQELLDGSVLYIEDSASQREVLKAILKEKGYRVDAHADAESALTALEQNDYDVVLTDIVLDGSMSGIGLVNRIRRLTDAKGDIPVLAITAFDDSARRMDLFNLGISDYVIKPVVTEELLVRINGIVTRRRQLARIDADRSALRAARAAAEKASHGKSEFLASLSHEIRTPMNAILGLTYLLQRGCRDTQQLEQLAKIHGAAQHLLTILNDVLDLAKIEAGKLQLESGDFSPAEIVAKMLDLVHGKANEKGLTLNTDLTDLPMRLQGDGTRLGQILLNFLSNAVKFTQRGCIVLQAKTLPAEEGRYRVRFEISDEGIGLSAEACDRLFQPFEQASISTAREHGGTGLGLAISRRLAELMAGRIGVNSTPGKGSTFWVELPFERPLAEKLAAPQGEDLEARLCARGGHILVAEDNELNQEIVLELLRGVGLTVTLAANGAEALELARQHDFDLILMDMQMPSMGGIEATGRIRQLPHHQRTPIVALTASVFESDRTACLTAGMNDHLAKPVDPDTLYAKLLQWLPTRPGP